VLLGNGEQRCASLTAAFNARFSVFVGIVEAVTGAFALPLNGADFQHPKASLSNRFGRVQSPVTLPCGRNRGRIKGVRNYVLLLTMFALSPVLGADSDEKMIAWVQKTVQDAQPTRSERKFDEVGWAKDIRDAERLAKIHQRPIFLFTHDGRVNLGRC
jgi:hypothetical protein